MRVDGNKNTFFELLRGGLWESEVLLTAFERIDFSIVYQLAVEQSVVGLIAVGLEHLPDLYSSKQGILPFTTSVIMLEKRNLAMNVFLAKLLSQLYSERLFPVLVKGQGIAQCYKRPSWRVCGDVDLLLDEEGYYKAKDILTPLAQKIESEGYYQRHFGMSLEGWDVELHGTLRTAIFPRIDKEIDFLQDEMSRNKGFRFWENNGVSILLPSPDFDVIFIFTHILKHLFNGGIGIRQVCDLSRLLWVFKDEIDVSTLSSRLNNMRLMSEWKVFASVMVDYLGAPEVAIPFYRRNYRRKADRLVNYIMEVGNFGHNKDFSFRNEKQPALIRKLRVFFHQLLDSLRLFHIFPLDAILFLWGFVYYRLFKR